MPDAILLLAGGEARRFPGKLEHEIDGTPIIIGVFERLRLTGLPIYVAANRSFSPRIAATLGAPLLIDREPHSGPLRALLDAAEAMPAERIFAVAADLPQIEASLFDLLVAAWQPGDEAVVPQDARGIEPLAAIYARAALLREGPSLRRDDCVAMRDLIARLATRFVAADERYFINVNRITDLPARANTA